MSDERMLAEEIAREHFYSPGAFNERAFAEAYSIFLILRRQSIRHAKKGELNYGLALNNVVTLLNSYGKVATNEVVRLLFDPQLQKVPVTLLKFLRADVPPCDDIDHEIMTYLKEHHTRYHIYH